MNTPHQVEQLNSRLKSLALADRLKLIAQSFPTVCLPTTFGTEDQLITWAIVESNAAVDINTPLSGALLSDAATLMDITNERYDFKIAIAAPNADAILINGRCQHVVNADRSVQIITWNTKRAALQINPLADWSFQEVLHAVAEHEVPINPLFEASATQHSKTRPHLEKNGLNGREQEKRQTTPR